MGGWLGAGRGSPQHQAHQSSSSFNVSDNFHGLGLLLGSSVRGRETIFTCLFQFEKFCDHAILCGKKPSEIAK